MSREIQHWEDEIAGATAIIDRCRARVNRTALELARRIADRMPGVDDAGERLADARTDLRLAEAHYGRLIDTGPVYARSGSGGIVAGE